MRTLRAKVVAKAVHYPDQLDVRGVDALRTFREFDDRYTAPLHGFADAAEYWARCGSIRFLDAIAVPTLLVNARDDPFLAGECWPEERAREHAHLHLETPRHGGHVGFVTFSRDGEYWSESRTAAFLEPRTDAGRV